jgi:hypothetical protein
MSKTRNIRRLKKRSHALPSLPWLGHEQEGGKGEIRFFGEMERQEQGTL